MNQVLVLISYFYVALSRTQIYTYVYRELSSIYTLEKNLLFCVGGHLRGRQEREMVQDSF